MTTIVCSLLFAQYSGSIVSVMWDGALWVFGVNVEASGLSISSLSWFALYQTRGTEHRASKHQPHKNGFSQELASHTPACSPAVYILGECVEPGTFFREGAESRQLPTTEEVAATVRYTAAAASTSSATRVGWGSRAGVPGMRMCPQGGGRR